MKNKPCFLFDPCCIYCQYNNDCKSNHDGATCPLNGDCNICIHLETDDDGASFYCSELNGEENERNE